VVHRLEMARDRRLLVAHEEELHKLLKMKHLRLTSLQHSMQESQLLWLKEGDANTRFFHIHTNVRRRRKFIRSLEHNGHTLSSEASKGEHSSRFLMKSLGCRSRGRTLSIFSS
jgi:hypothetical protein